MARYETQPGTDQEPYTPTGPLAGYKLEGLFGRRTVEFDIADSGPTLLTGANGSGKSTVLRTIHAVSAGDWGLLARTEFSKLTLNFASEEQITVERTDEGLRIGRSNQPTWVRPNSTAFLVNTGTASIYPVLTASQHYVPQSAISGVTFSGAWPNLFVGESTPPWIDRISRDFPVLYIPDNRREEEAGETATVSAAAAAAASDIGRIVETGLAEYPQQAQAIDRDFPTRVTAEMAEKEIYSNKQLRELLDAANSRQVKLRQVGLLPGEELMLTEVNLEPVNAKAVIRVFVEDMIKKFDALEGLRTKLDLFTRILNQHYKGKQVIINGVNGAVIIDTETEEQALIPAYELSSGEQQLLILAHRVLFRTGPGTLVLIDEPELSLHVVWQDTFVDDLSLMGALSNLGFILATHSPTLIAGRDDLRRPLGAP